MKSTWEGRTDMSNAHTGPLGPRNVMGMTRRVLLGSAVAVAAGAVTAPAAEAREVPALWREFNRAPFTHPQIPYVGRAGCHGGATRFPRHRVVADVRDFGAVAGRATRHPPAVHPGL